MKERLSLAAARRMALAAQGFAQPRPPPPIGRRDLRRMIGRLGLLQIDSVNVLTRAHYMPAFSRLGPYAQALLEAEAWTRKDGLFEYWAHEASLLPVETQPLLRWRMERAERMEGTWKSVTDLRRRRPGYVEDVFQEVVLRGPLPASALEGERGAGGWWGWSDAKRALEWLFWAGRITTATRRGGFERFYDLPERVLPKAVLAAPTPEPAEAQRELLRISARALGVATASDLRDYFRLSVDDVKARLPELVEAGDLLPVQVEGWRQPAYVHPAARSPRRIDARALLSPFDPLIWERSRTERLFDFRYRLEIYTPAEKRVYGYYVLPFLHRERLVARTDLKADRQRGVLMVASAFAEPAAPPDTAEQLLSELRNMAAWLGLESVEIGDRGDLAPTLSRIAG